MEGWEPGEVLVRGVKYAPVFYHQRREVCVGYQISRGVRICKLLLENMPMVFCRADHANAGLVKPTAGPLNGLR